MVPKSRNKKSVVVEFRLEPLRGIGVSSFDCRAVAQGAKGINDVIRAKPERQIHAGQEEPQLLHEMAWISRTCWPQNPKVST